MTSFAQLGLSAPILRALDELGYTTPTPIQAQAIPVVLEGGDLMAGAQTGTGKTAGFTLPLLERLNARRGSGRPVLRALILTPTRELAAQVEESVRQYGKHLPIRSMMMFGGVGMQPQIDALRRGVDILVATPGRLLDHMQQGHVDLSHVEVLVLDEADRMLDMGFIRDIRRVLAKLPAQRQNLLFSATFSDEIKALANGLLNAPRTVEVAKRNATAHTVGQTVYLVDRERKRELLTHLIREHNWFQVLVFTRTKHGANRLAEQLDKDGIGAMAIHGNKSQSARTRALAAFKDASLQVLVATDIAARGIDIDQLPYVVNFDLPNVPEDYVHRIGRTGRAGATGDAVSLVCVDDIGFLADIEKLTGNKLDREIVPGFEPDPNQRPEPVLQRGRGQRGGGQAQGQRQAPRQGQEPRATQGARAGNSERPARESAGAGGRGGRPNPGGNGARPAQSAGNGRGSNGAQGGNGGNGGNGGGRSGRPAQAAQGSGGRSASGGQTGRVTRDNAPQARHMEAAQNARRPHGEMPRQRQNAPRAALLGAKKV
ncbi:DEAD/DEAH box helicase [Chitinasiproducens palmae]|uniref:ATP-dependent RNA helicase RhlE n=1 Tax=Chitinasiproducens palmae TaxID=1770053 RepID=A0A1H2PNC7_9BURK|nr:DEAD/DEAH box helicase [Chitinasiproducens palmae]SDV48082.1 ATP-dependent RNA helicase RhlE [Chitinasiproducens palmae]